jgi:hypothetical protein
MTPPEIEMCLARLQSSIPPNDLDTLRFTSSLPWSGSDNREIRIYTEIVLRLTADAIVIKFSEDIDLKSKYKKVFLSIIENAINKNLMSDSEFKEYFLKLKTMVLSI